MFDLHGATARAAVLVQVGDGQISVGAHLGEVEAGCALGVDHADDDRFAGGGAERSETDGLDC